MANNTNIILFKQYATYQACLDLFSEQLSVDDVFKKVFLYVLKWLKNRIGETTLEKCPDLQKYPEPWEYEKFDIKDMYGFKLLSEMDIRLFNLQEENCWAMRITEPDNYAEFKRGNRDDVEQIRNRSFVTEVALRKNDDSVTLAVQIICKEPKANERDADSFRPAFVNNLFRDKELQMVETGLDRQFRFQKEYNEDGKTTCTPILVDSRNADAFVRDFILNTRRQMPVVICPECVRDETYPVRIYRNDEIIDMEGTIDTLAYSLIGYAHVVVVDAKVIDFVFEHKKLKCIEYEDVLKDNCLIFHRGFDRDTGLPDMPTYLPLENEEEPADVSEEEQTDEQTFRDETVGKKPLKIMEEEAKRYSVRKLYNFQPAKFYRELKKQYYKYQGKHDTEAAISNLEHENTEKEAQIQDLSSKLAQIERESKKRSDELKSKFENSQEAFKQYKERYEQAQKKVDTNEQVMKSMRDEYENKIRQKDLMINMLTGKEIEDPDDKRLELFRKSTPKEVIFFGERFQDQLVKNIVRNEVRKIFYSAVTDLEGLEIRLKRKVRRLKLLRAVLQYEKYLTDMGMESPVDALFYYPSEIEVYDGELRDVLLDILFDKSEDNALLDCLLEDNDFDFIQEEKKNRLRDKLNGYRRIGEIKGTLESVGLRCIASEDHYIYVYYTDEECKITVAGSPSDTNSGKNLADEIIERCL